MIVLSSFNVMLSHDKSVCLVLSESKRTLFLSLFFDSFYRKLIKGELKYTQSIYFPIHFLPDIHQTVAFGFEGQLCFNKEIDQRERV